MNLEGARVVLRTRTASEIFDLAVRFCASIALSLYLRLAVLVLLPCVVGCVVLHHYYDKGEWAVTWTVAALLAAFAQGVFTIAASRLLFESRPTVGGILLHALRRLPALIGALLIFACLAGAGMFVIVGTPFVWAWQTYLYEAVLLEQQGPFAAVGRAGALIKRKFSNAVLVCIGSAAIVALFIVSAELLGRGLVEFVLQIHDVPVGDLFDDGGSLYALLGFFAALPLVATARFLSYIDGRTRQDGWDIQLRFMSIAAASGEAPP